jgi:hypothetical protein
MSDCKKDRFLVLRREAVELLLFKCGSSPATRGGSFMCFEAGKVFASVYVFERKRNEDGRVPLTFLYCLIGR